MSRLSKIKPKEHTPFVNDQVNFMRITGDSPFQYYPQNQALPELPIIPKAPPNTPVGPSPQQSGTTTPVKSSK